MSNPLRILLLVIIAAVGAYAFKTIYVNVTNPANATVPSTDRVRVAAADLPEGLLLRDSDLAWKTVPHNSTPNGAIVDAPGNTVDFKGNVLRHAVTADTIIATTDTLSPSSPGFLAAALKPGMRAVSVGIDDVSGNAGLIQPGDFVDLLLTQQIDTKTDGTPGHSYASETVVSRVRVLAVGSEYQRPKSDSEANTRARTVTLEVLPETAQVIAVASRLGNLSLALRSFATSDRSPIGSSTPAAEHPLPPVYASQVSRALGTPGTPVAPISTDIMVYRGSDGPVSAQSASANNRNANAAQAPSTPAAAYTPAASAAPPPASASRNGYRKP